jgi:hypothetical protein
MFLKAEVIRLLDDIPGSLSNYSTRRKPFRVWDETMTTVPLQLGSRESNGANWETLAYSDNRTNEDKIAQ